MALISNICVVSSQYSSHTNDSSLIHLATVKKKSITSAANMIVNWFVPPVFYSNTQPEIVIEIVICFGNHFEIYLDMFYFADPRFSSFWANLSKVSA